MKVPFYGHVRQYENLKADIDAKMQEVIQSGKFVLGPMLSKFEGLEVSRSIFRDVAGLFHVGSVGIIMSGWLGAINYGIIVANDADAYLHG